MYGILVCLNNSVYGNHTSFLCLVAARICIQVSFRTEGAECSGRAGLAKNGPICGQSRAASCADMHEDASSSQRSKDVSRKKQVLLSASAATFVLGAVGAAAYAFRKRPFPAASHVELHTPPQQATKSMRAVAPVLTEESSMPDKSAWEIFRDMHIALFSSSKRARPVKPIPVSHTRPTGSPLSALSRAPSTQERSAAPAALSKTRVAPPPEDTEGQGDDGPMLAIFAFSTATIIVGASALVATLLVRYGLGIRSIEEFADKMHDVLPSLNRDARLARYLPAVPPRPPAEPDVPLVDLTASELEHKLEHTEDPQDWMRYAVMQLESEQAAHEAAKRERRQRRLICTNATTGAAACDA